MASNVRKLAVEILGDASGAQKAMRSVEESSQKLGDNIGRLAKGMAGAFATQQIATFAKDAVGAAMDDAKAQALLAQQLKASTGATSDQIAAVEDFIEKTQNSTGVLDDQLRPAFATFVRFTGNATKAQDLLTLAMDVSTGTGKDLGTVSTALARAYAGNTGALARLGVQTKDASGKALEFDDIQKQLAQTFGGQTAAAADTAAGKMAIARANFESTKEEIGMALIPVLGALVDAFKPITDIFLALPEGAQTAIVFGTLATAGFGAAKTALTNFGISAGSATKMLGGLGVAFGVATVIGKIFEAGSESNTEETKSFTEALRENDEQLRASKIREIARDEPQVREYLETMALLGITVNDFAEYARTGEGKVKFFRDTLSTLRGTGEPVQIQMSRLAAEMGVFIDTADMSGGEIERLSSDFHNLQFVAHNAWLEFHETTGATDATASAMMGLALEGEDAADALDEVTGAAFELTEQWKQTLGYFDQQQAWNNLTDSIGELAKAQELAFGKPSQENQRAYEDALGKVYDRVAAYIEQVGDIPAETQTEILAKLNEGDVIGATLILDNLTKQRVVPIRLGDLDIETRRALNIGARANGGPVTGGMPYVVGERGPELFVPSSSGSIVPRIPATMGAGGGSTTVNVNVTSANPDDVVAAIKTWVRRNGQAPVATTTGVRY